MTTRRSHYEMAFEAYLTRRGVAFTSVEDARPHVPGRLGLKTFDYIVYPSGGPPCLVDVKGRKSRLGTGSTDCRQKTWVTRADIEGLQAWEGVFGHEYRAMFAFAYWLADAPAGGDADWPEDWIHFAFAGRCYSFWLVTLEDYLTGVSPLSQSWQTVAVPRTVFRSVSRPLPRIWPAAPC